MEQESATKTVLKVIENTTSTDYDTVLRNYTEILEKTNQQLGLWTNPYGIMVGILTFLVAIGAIIVAWYLWKNSKEQRDLYFETIQNHKKQIEEQYELMLEKQNIQLASVVKEFEKVKDSVTDEKKTELEEVIKKYQDKIIDLEGEISKKPVKVSYGYGLPNLNSVSLYAGAHKKTPEINTTICFGCGNVIQYYEEDIRSPLTTIQGIQFFGTQRQVQCPYCKIMNNIK